MGCAGWFDGRAKSRKPTARSMLDQQEIRFAQGHDGVRLAYATTGEGPLLIKAATWLSHLEFDWNSPVWGHVLRGLSAHARLARYDERGCGMSDWDVQELSFESWVRDLACVVEAIGEPRFALLGISQGASIAIAYAVRHPERVTHLVLHGGYARGRLVRSNTPREREEVETMTKLAELGWGQADPAFRQFFTTQFIPDGRPEQHQWFNELERISTSPANAARFMRVFAEIDVRALLPRVQCPTLVLHSKRDLRQPFEEGRLIASGIPGARLVPIDSGNHLLLEDEPGWSQWLDEVCAFLPTRAPRGDPLLDTLSARERELLELLAQGRDNAQIAASLGLAEKTVRNRLSALFAKLGVDHRGRAIVIAHQAGLGHTRR